MKWDTWNTLEYNRSTAKGLTGGVVTPLLAAVLCARGIDTPEKIEAWLRTDTDGLHDPMAMADAATAVDRLRCAIDTNEKVAVYGDYDVDGITASTVMADYLKTKGLDCQVYIPDRLEEGYGLNTAALETLAQSGVTLVITVDCGITAVEETEIAKTLGVDMLITDHHECQDALPQAVAVVDPKRADCGYPDKELAGVGVAFKLICAAEGPEHTEALLERYGDLVAVGTVADVMNLVGENRIFVRHGLEALRKGNRVGLKCLIDQAGLDAAKLNVTNIGYGLAPRINAAGRMGNAELAFSLLVAGTEPEADALAEQLCDLNRQRQQVESEILDEARELLEKESYAGGPIILASQRWHKGVVGIVASRLTEQYQEPVVMLCIEGDEAKGSCRSARGFNLFEALRSCGEYLTTFGGHELAAGLTVDTARLEDFKRAFGAYYREHGPSDTGSALEADFTVGDPDLITLEQIRSLEALEPCGRGNPSPVLIMEGARLRRVQPIGGGKHLRLQVERWGVTYDCVFFSMTPEGLAAGEGDQVDMAFTPQINSFRGKTTVQLLVKDVCPTERRLTGRAKGLYTRLMDGENLSAVEASVICPDRSDFVRLWKRLGTGDAVDGRLEEVLCDLARGGGDGAAARSYTCLKVMDELGLAKVRESADCVNIELKRDSAKVDLNTSRVLAALKRAME